MGALITLTLAPIAGALALMAAYLWVLSIAALTSKAPPPVEGRGTRRFAVLVPAHDEASTIERVLRSLRAQTYPADRFDIIVVADNCTDATAQIARREGATVHERRDPMRRSKGYALGWLLERIRSLAYDAYVIFDADSIVDPEFLRCMDARLSGGALVVQSHYRVLNGGASPIAALREAAFASLHYLRPRGRAALGLSCGLKGNGMCFDAGTLDRIGWIGVGLAEDVELHLAIVRRGVCVNFAGEVSVRADMPTTLSGSKSQNTRWEAGRIASLRHDALPLLGTGIRRRDFVMVDAAIEQLVPPLSAAVVAALASLAVGFAIGSPVVEVLGGVAMVGFSAHVLVGMMAIRASANAYVALLTAPAYIAWKVALYARAAFAPSNLPWVRTARSNGTAPLGRGSDGP